MTYFSQLALNSLIKASSNLQLIQKNKNLFLTLLARSSSPHHLKPKDKITSRIAKLCYGLNPKFVDPIRISQKVIQGVYPGVTTTELDELAAQTAAYNATQHPDFSILAARISVSNLHKMTKKRFSDNIEMFYNYTHPITHTKAPLISKKLYDCVRNTENPSMLLSSMTATLSLIISDSKLWRSHTSLE